MEPITTTMIAAALAQGLVQVGQKLVEKGVVEPATGPVTEKMKALVQRGYRGAEQDKALFDVVKAALTEAGTPTEDEDKLDRYLKGVSLDRLTAEKNDPLRRQMARAVLAFTNPDAAPPPTTWSRLWAGPVIGLGNFPQCWQPCAPNSSGTCPSSTPTKPPSWGCWVTRWLAWPDWTTFS